MPKSPAEAGIPPIPRRFKFMDDEMDQYIHDNTDDEITHHTFP